MKYFLILSLISLSFNAVSQCCPYIDNIEVIPASPTTSDDIKIVTTVTTPTIGKFLSSSYSINGNTITIEACYFSGGLNALDTHYDTLNIGTLNADAYTIDFTAHLSLDTTNCTYTDSSNSGLGFMVSENQASINTISQQIGKLFPNPSNGSFAIELPDGVQATHVRIRSISGEVIEQMDFSEQINLHVESGMYLIQFLEGDSIIGYQRLVIQ